MSKKEVQVKEESKDVVIDSFLDELTADSETYKESLSQDDMAIPFLVILQALSPACTEGDPGYIEDARPGMLFNTVTKEVYDAKKDPLLILPVAYKSSYIEWVPRSTGKGGFVAEHSAAGGLQAITIRNDDNEDIVQANSPIGQPGNQLAYTHTHFIFVIDKDTGIGEPAVLTMASSQIKHSKKFNQMVNNLKLPNSNKGAPRFFGIWELSTELETKGDNKWQSWSFKKSSDVVEFKGGKELYHSAKEFNDGLKSGEHKAEYDKVAPEARENPSLDPVPADAEEDSEIPF